MVAWNLETRDDEIMRLITKILELRSKINTQMNTLNNSSLGKNPLNNNLSNKSESDIEEKIRGLLKAKESEAPADFKSLNINYEKADYHLVPDDDNLEWKLDSTTKRNRIARTHPQKCDECKYKEGIEEALNILAVCGFIRREGT